MYSSIAINSVKSDVATEGKTSELWWHLPQPLSMGGLCAGCSNLVNMYSTLRRVNLWAVGGIVKRWLLSTGHLWWGWLERKKYMMDKWYDLQDWSRGKRVPGSNIAAYWPVCTEYTISCPGGGQNVCEFRSCSVLTHFCSFPCYTSSWWPQEKI